MSAVDKVVSIVVIMTSEDNVNEALSLLGQLIIVGLSLVAQANDDLCALLSQLRHELLGNGRGGPVFEVRRKTVDCLEPLTLSQPDETNLDAVGGGEHVRLLGVSERNLLAQVRVDDVGEEPGEVALAREVLILLDAKVKVVVL
jgi:hypothetical protein